MPNWIKYIMGKIRVNSGSGKKVLVNNPGQPSTAHVNRPIGSPIPIKTGKDIGVSSYPVYLRNTANTAEIGTAANKGEVVTILNADPGWSAYGVWSQDSNGIFCTGSPAKIIGYNKVGQLYNQATLAHWTYSDADISLTQYSGTQLRLTTTNQGAVHKMVMTGYQKTLLCDIEYSMDLEVLSVATANGFRWNMGIDNDRILKVSYSSVVSIQDGASENFSAGTIGYTTGTYHFRIRIHGNETTFWITKGAETITGTKTTTPTLQEHAEGHFFIECLGLDVLISNVIVNCTAYKNIDYLCVGDSVTWGRGADSWAGTWFNQVVNGQPATWFCHGNTGFLIWTAAIAELQAVNPAVVYIMGSYTDTPAGLSTFQSRYNNLITIIKAGTAIQRIYHCVTFPNNFSEDIRPFNNWKAATFITGIDRVIDNFYPLLLEGTSGYDLKNSYDAGGSHLTQAAQTIVANSMLLEI